jgi:hypothetical protein
VRTGNSVQACTSANGTGWNALGGDSGHPHGRHGVCGSGRVRAQQRGVEHRDVCFVSDAPAGVPSGPASLTRQAR